MAHPQSGAPMTQARLGRSAILPKPLKALFVILNVAAVGAFVFYNFGWSIAGWVFLTQGYHYLLFALLVPCVFLTVPARKKDRDRVPWYDLIMAALGSGICIYFYLNASSIANIGWVPPRTTYDIILASIFGAMALESGRRLAGTPFLIIGLIAVTYPLVAGYVPGIFRGMQFQFDYVIGAFAYGQTGMLGLPAHVMGSILIAFLVFAGFIMASGAGDFFLNLALGITGQFRGGPAKVAVLSSGFFGSLSGNAFANIVTTGSVTIPTMKRLGYPSHYAGAIEAVASGGGAIMPPVMGSIAFIIAVFIGVDYSVVMIAAFLPAILYYFGLLMQVDAYAARVGIKGVPREEFPSIWKTLKKGWPFIAVLAFLVFGLVYMRWGAKTPIFASGLIILLSFTSRETMMTPKRIVEAMVTVGAMLAQAFTVLLPIGFIIGGLSMTGTAASLTAQLHTLGGGNIYLILLIGMAVCYVFGLVGMAVIAYIVLAVTMAPALVQLGGLNILSVHLFITYYCLLGGFTPPVALYAFVAASVADSPPMKTAWTSMRLGIVLYFLPFFFVMNPALILEGPIYESLYLFALCLIGITLIAGGLEGYLVMVGRLSWWTRIPLVAAGFLIALPEWKTTIYGFILAALVIAIILVWKKTAAQKLTTNSQ